MLAFVFVTSLPLAVLPVEDRPSEGLDGELVVSMLARTRACA